MRDSGYKSAVQVALLVMYDYLEFKYTFYVGFFLKITTMRVTIMYGRFPNLGIQYTLFHTNYTKK